MENDSHHRLVGLSKMDFESFPLAESLDVEIVMHRNAHFGGKFEFMLEYYFQEGKGVQEDFSLERIEELGLIEIEMQEDLTNLLLSDAEIDMVQQSLSTYSEIREVYEIDNPKNKFPLLISNLILSEEEHPLQEIEAIVKEKRAIVPYLHKLIHSDKFYDPLFPGYGYAPLHAFECLGRIGDVSSIPLLFEKIGSGSFLNEETIFQALRAFGSSAEEFLLKVLKGKPLTVDNERAAIALLQFEENEAFARYSLELLQDPAVLTNPTLTAYLVLGCEGLQNPEHQKEFLLLLNNPKIPTILHEDIRAIARHWFPNLRI